MIDASDEIRELRASLAHAEARFRDLIERNADGVVVVDRGGVVRFANPAATRLLGRPIEQILGAPFGFPLVNEDATEVDVVRRMGSSLVAEMRAVSTTWEGEPAMLASLRDVSRRIQQEETLRKKEEQLRQAQKAEAMGRLAAEVAHDLNNLLMGVSGCVHVALDELPTSHAARPYVEEIERASRHGATLTRQLLAFNRRRTVTPSLLDLGEVTHDLIVLMHRLVGSEIEIQTEIEPSSWPVEADRGLLEQVLMNLVVNARDAITDRGVLHVRIHNVDDGAIRWVTLEVQDSGCGMPPETIAHIFEPFFTTKPEGVGTGLGLSTVDSIVSELGGRVVVESQVGQGTTIRVFFRAATQLASKPVVSLPHVVAADGETLLVVDDDHRVRISACKILEKHGFHILEASSGEEALELLSTRGQNVRLLLTDIRMPGMNGRELADRVAAQRPDIRVLFMSGYSGTVLGQKQLVSNGAALLEKPFTVDALLRAVQAQLREPAPPVAATATREGPASLLVVEDDRLARMALVRILGFDFRVVEAESANTALSAVEQHGEFDLILTDLKLPDMAGAALIQQLRQRWPHQKVVYMSGFSAEHAEHTGMVERGAAFVQKPIDLDELTNLLQRVLASA